MDENIDKRSNSMDDKTILKRLLSYAYPYKYQFIIIFLFMLLSVGSTSLQPILLGDTLDILAIENFQYSHLVSYILMLFVLIIVAYTVDYFVTLRLQTIGQSIVLSIRNQIFKHLETHDINYLNNVPTGSLVTRVTNDTNTINEMYTSVVVSVVKNVILLVVMLLLMFYKNVQLALFMLISLPFVAVITFFFRLLSRKIYRDVRNNTSRINAFLSEHLSGMKIVQIFNQEDNKFKEFDELNTKLKKSNYKQIFVFGVYHPSMYLMYMIAVLVILFVGSQNVFDSTITIGTLLTFYLFAGKFFDPIQELAEQFNVLQSAFASSERIFGILDTKPTVKDADDAIDLTEIKGDIEFKNVWFKYLEDEWILKGVSFKVNARESVAFVGATGSGKSTILSLLTRNYDIQEGQILIDGIDIKKIKKDSLRTNIGQMLQDVFMFSGTIKSNIKLNSNEITDEEMIEACKYVNANQFIEKLEHKYEEQVRERGNNYSSGQRQLISFARTIVHKPSIMILDEATSNIDTETEQLIQDSLNKMMSIGTMLIVAHRLSTIQHVDQIIVLSKGEIIEQGNHQELLKQKGHYYNLYRIQYQD